MTELDRLCRKASEAYWPAEADDGSLRTDLEATIKATFEPRWEEIQRVILGLLGGKRPYRRKAKGTSNG